MCNSTKLLLNLGLAMVDGLQEMVLGLSYGKTSSLKKFETNGIFQESSEVFEDETATAEAVEQKGLAFLMFSNVVELRVAEIPKVPSKGTSHIFLKVETNSNEKNRVLNSENKLETAAAVAADKRQEESHLILKLTENCSNEMGDQNHDKVLSSELSRNNLPHRSSRLIFNIQGTTVFDTSRGEWFIKMPWIDSDYNGRVLNDNYSRAIALIHQVQDKVTPEHMNLVEVAHQDFLDLDYAEEVSSNKRITKHPSYVLISRPIFRLDKDSTKCKNMLPQIMELILKVKCKKYFVNVDIKKMFLSINLANPLEKDMLPFIWGRPGDQLRGDENTPEETIQTTLEILKILENVGFYGHKIASSQPEILSEIEPERIAPPRASQVFDTHGYVTQCRMQFKLIVPLLWEDKIKWDEKLQSKVKAAKEAIMFFTKWIEQIPLMNDLRFQRYNEGSIKVLDVFGDASKHEDILTIARAELVALTKTVTMANYIQNALKPWSIPITQEESERAEFLLIKFEQEPRLMNEIKILKDNCSESEKRKIFPRLPLRNLPVFYDKESEVIRLQNPIHLSSTIAFDTINPIIIPMGTLAERLGLINPEGVTGRSSVVGEPIQDSDEVETNDTDPGKEALTATSEFVLIPPQRLEDAEEYSTGFTEETTFQRKTLLTVNP
ncbi:unnamed protein product [Lepeophtheirus salmonis]|uniref:(salmon louse) hypothetical protein n=1 Tax=Lepeophtheirus salmonis TaxID=72036 RepID=A0A7R8CAL1_LEPSM|nr:unnamed protein product [Lepeophtheirus salmonis]CAF2752193.1 unnamed protein product [Lepeophtheirus salmonis]